MLLTSPGDHGSSLPADSLQSLPSGSSLEGQSSIEDDRVTATESLETLVESYHAPIQLKDELASSSLCLHADASTPLRNTQTTKATSSGTPQVLGQSAWSKPPSQELDLDGLYALRQAATLKALRQSNTRVWSKHASATLPDVRGVPIDLFSFAAPLSPLRERDLTVLSEFFLRDDMPAIEADISQRLISLLPEPCWEDDVFDFLKEFL